MNVNRMEAVYGTADDPAPRPIEVLACPFCGRPGLMIDEFWVECSNCSAVVRGPHAVNQWNRRPPGLMFEASEVQTIAFAAFMAGLLVRWLLSL